MAAFIVALVSACLAAGAIGALLAIWAVERRRPRDTRPAKRTGAAGRGPSRAHRTPAHPVPRPPLAARNDDPTEVRIPVITRPIQRSPLGRQQ